MLNMIEDIVRFPEKMTGGRTITRVFKTYPFKVYKANSMLSAIDYGFSDQEGMFFRTTIDTYAEIKSPYEVHVVITFGFRSREFDKATDATIRYTLLLQQVYCPFGCFP